MTKGYGQFCPVAKAAEVICNRWTPLILRELMFGNQHFNAIARGVPLMSRSLLAQRLRELEDAGVVSHSADDTGTVHEYRLTPAGEALRPIIEQMGVWAQRWGRGRLEEQDLDDTLLMWGVQRRIKHAALPPRRVVLRFDFRGLRRGRVAQRCWWLILDGDAVDLCLKDPGFEVDAVIAADLGAFTRVWLGHTALQAALRAGDIAFAGPRELTRQVPEWLYLNGELKYRMGIYVPGRELDELLE
ncbi:MAG TPA: helix-turn-helix domain-containing protein [Candidatus Competibacteraceae bacterium]|nr:helix-turn-helix domain-containing protein [Candidatus Competibacteraceae bacterium]